MGLVEDPTPISSKRRIYDASPAPEMRGLHLQTDINSAIQEKWPYLPGNTSASYSPTTAYLKTVTSTGVWKVKEVREGTLEFLPTFLPTHREWCEYLCTPHTGPKPWLQLPRKDRRILIGILQESASVHSVQNIFGRTTTLSPSFVLKHRSGSVVSRSCE